MQSMAIFKISDSALEMEVKVADAFRTAKNIILREIYLALHFQIPKVKPIKARL